MLDAGSSVPLYRQLAERLGVAIGKGRYPLGERIPSEPSLAAQYRIGRPTVRQATELLVRRGVLERRQGAGTFVVSTKPRELDVFSMAGTLAAFREGGVEVQVRVLEPVQTRVLPSEVDNPFAGREAYVLRRLSSTEQGPVLLEETYLDPELFPKLERFALQGQSLAALVRERYRSEPTGGQQQFCVVTATAAQARLLGVKKATALLQVRRHLHFPRRDSAIYAELYFRTDRVVLSQQLGGS